MSSVRQQPGLSSSTAITTLVRSTVWLYSGCGSKLSGGNKKTRIRGDGRIVVSAHNTEGSQRLVLAVNIEGKHGRRKDGEFLLCNPGRCALLRERYRLAPGIDETKQNKNYTRRATNAYIV